MRCSKNLFVLAALMTIGAAATAQPASSDSPRTRAEVIAETRAAVAAGRIPHGEVQSKLLRKSTSTTSRAAVRAETLAAIAAGDIARGEVEPDDSDDFESTRTRAEVRAETLEAVRLDLIPHGDEDWPNTTAGHGEM